VEIEISPLEEAIKIQEIIKPLGYDVIGFKKEKSNELVLFLDCSGRFKCHAVEDFSTLINHK
jgi:hypothetical protein